jgi:RNase P subunit RPR2
MMTNDQANELVTLCNGCGEPMRFMGEWPVQFPKSNGPKNIQQVYRWICRTCRTPSEASAKGVPVAISIVGMCDGL